MHTGDVRASDVKPKKRQAGVVNTYQGYGGWKMPVWKLRAMERYRYICR